MQALTRISILAFLLTSGAAAQPFQGLSTTADGSVLYFSSSIRQKGTDQRFYSKIFQWTAATGVQVIAEVRNPGPSDGCASPDYYDLHAPQVSADGNVRAYTASRRVERSRYCPRNEPNQGIIETSGRTTRLAGNLALSPNGRYAVTTTTTALENDFHTVTDLVNGQSAIVAGAFNGSSRRVTDDGTIVTPKPSAVVLTDRAGGTRVLLAKYEVDDAMIDPRGASVVYLTRLGPSNPARLSAIDVKTGRETELANGFVIYNPMLAADGARVFYHDLSGHLFAVGIDGGNRQKIADQPVAAISGNGLVAFATGNSGLVRIELASGAVTELVAPTPFVTAAYLGFRPQPAITPVGSVIELVGSGLKDAQTLTFCGRPVSLSMLQGHVRFQVPWDLPEGLCQAVVASGSSFEHAVDFEVRQYDPQFVLGYGTPALIYHQAFAGMVYQGSPARPGEVIVVSMTGLGPVDSGGLIGAGFGCRFDFTPAEIAYAGVAPQSPGVYQINVRVPPLAASTPTLTCGWDATRQAATSLWAAP